jgi:plasmid replication initiation protein
MLAVEQDDDFEDSERSASTKVNTVDAPEGFTMASTEQRQPLAFSGADITIQDYKPSFKKAVGAIHVVPTKDNYSQSLNGRRLFDAFIVVAQMDAQNRGRDFIRKVREDRVSPLIRIRIGELCTLAGIPGLNYERVYKEIEKLHEVPLAWNVVNEVSEIEWRMHSHFLASYGIGESKYQGEICFSIDPSVLNIILEPSNWATLSLKAMEGLRTSASYALYQNAWRYINTSNKVTASLPTETWIELLVGKSSYVVDDPERGKLVVNYKDFKRRVLLNAIERVNAVSALSYTLELKEYKSGKRVSKIQFKFVPKQQVSTDLPVTLSDDVVADLEKIGFSRLEIKNMSQAFSYEMISDAIERLRLAVIRQREAGRPIINKKSYFNGILNNINNGAIERDIEEAKLEAQAKVLETAKLAKEREERRREEFSKHQSDVFNKNFFGLDEEARTAVIEAFMGSEAGQKACILVERGWKPQNVGLLVILRSWVQSSYPEAAMELLPNPEDQEFESYLAWKLDGGAPASY